MEFSSKDLEQVGLSNRALQLWREKKLLRAGFRGKQCVWDEQNALLAMCLNELRSFHVSSVKMKQRLRSIRRAIGGSRFLAVFGRRLESNFSPWIEIEKVAGFNSDKELVDRATKSGTGILIVDIAELRERLARIHVRAKTMTAAA